jgi:predicted RNA-binding Zn ribbon-like protein
MDSLFLGGHPAVDFLNTRYTPDGAVIETIGDGKAFVAWLVEAGLLAPESAAGVEKRLSEKSLNAAAKEARDVREWARGWLADWEEPLSKPFMAEVGKLNELLRHNTVRREVVTTDAGLDIVDRPQVDDGQALLGLVAAQFASLVANESAPLLKQCAGSGCSLWFLDRTKSHRQRFCSVAACGNRAKVSAFRERQRSA